MFQNKNKTNLTSFGTRSCYNLSRLYDPPPFKKNIMGSLEYRSHAILCTSSPNLSLIPFPTSRPFKELKSDLCLRFNLNLHTTNRFITHLGLAVFFNGILIFRLRRFVVPYPHHTTLQTSQK